MLALAVEHIDTLLEDWYPSLGTRFLHTSEGKMLVTRMVPCPRCLTTHNERESKKSWQDFSFFKRDAPAEPPQPQAQALLRVSQVFKKEIHYDPVMMSQEVAPRKHTCVLPKKLPVWCEFPILC